MARSSSVNAFGDDLKVKMGVPFTRAARLKPGETVMFSWIVYKSRAHQTVAGRTMTRVVRHPAQRRDNQTQRSRSQRESRGRGTER